MPLRPAMVARGVRLKLRKRDSMESEAQAGFVALVTGGGSGIGREIVLEYAARGWRVLCHYHRCAQAEDLVRNITSQGGFCTLIRADLTDPVQVQALIESLRDVRVDALVNNAGSYIVPKHYSQLEHGDLAKIFQLNVFAPTLLSAALFEGMCSRKFGRIVNISSVAAKYGGSATSLLYGQTKRALEGLTLTLGKVGAANNVLVNTIRPGVVDTAFHDKFPKDISTRVAMIPAGRMANPQEVARMAVFLGSQENTFITRECVTVAGGE